ncbi:type II secretion system F family protein [Pyrococcus yayanosii]|uniref:Bacterial type II secretion system protein F domain protein n=1 Tax=Pyrococcus yayanosii (strain CH1 / JCM 16557) TaxID=529709 RepID=F8AEN3_PYRYC|nr:type II secretion system F family protein [Pyrococcus yayanosii]AEH24713.1 Bacterial type II secretion system protein F domain protein [Pyrococcus yayanosii CH1]
MAIKKKITNFLEKLGGKTIEVAEKPIRRIPRSMPIAERLQLLKKMQEEIQKEREKKEEEILEETIEWREKELQRPFSERFADAMLKYFRGPVESLSKSIKGLDVDLYRANMRMSRERYVALMLGVAIFAAIFGFLVGFLLYMPIDLSILLGLLGFIGGFMYMRYYPKIVWRRRVEEVERALPYVLRHMAALLNAGVGIAEALLSVANADYGAISEEFELMIRDMHGGASFEDAITRFEERMGSESVSRVVKQMLRAIKFGGNLADVLYKMAEDFSFEYRIKLMEYVQKVNGLAFIYMFLTVVMPTLMVVAILAASLMAKALVITIPALAVILLFAFPSLSFIMVMMIKRAEPR